MPPMLISEPPSYSGCAADDPRLTKTTTPLDTTRLTMRNTIQLTFIDEKEDIRWLSAENAARHRHSMFTDLERRNMSLELISSVPDQNPSQAIVDLQSIESDVRCSEPLSLFRGPFGAFRLLPQPQFENKDASPDDIDFPSGYFNEVEDLLGEVNIDQLPFTLDPADADDGDSSGFEWENLPLLQNIETDYCGTSLQSDITSDLSIGNAEGWSLLSHYKDRIVPLICPLRRGQETPWMKLLMPCAMNTLAELTLNGTPNHARLALLNAVWSTSAFHLANNTFGCLEQWTISAGRYLKRAQTHFQECMRESCISTTKKGKYKEILMAVLSLSNAFMIKGDSDKRRAYLVQTEKFISIKGLSQPKLSTKKRALHHCYAYMRIMAETTCIVGRLRLNLTETVHELNGNTTYGGDFRIYPTLVFSPTTMSMEKDPEMAQRDLHLAIPGHWSSTLFPTVYGVDEIFLMLLSQVIRLANERDFSMMSNVAGGMISLKDFWTRAKALERAIDNLLSSAHSHENQAHAGSPDMAPTAQAMYMGLFIFFHRRIYEIEPTMLQGKVNAMRNFLIQIQQDEGYQKDSTSAALIWPAFITACEAVDPELQEYFSSWFDYCARMTALVHVSVAKQIFEAIWAKRRDMSLRGETQVIFLR